MTELDPDKRNAIWVKVVEDGDAVGVGIYHVDPNTVADPVEGFMAEFLAGVLLQPDQCYEIAQRLTMYGMKVEDMQKGKPSGDGIIGRDDGGI